MKSRLLNILKVGLLPALFIAPSLQAVPNIAEQVLWDSTLNGGGNVIGFAVAIDGDWGFVGAPAGEAQNGKNYCQVYVYKFDYVTNLWGDGGLGVGNTVVTTTIVPDVPYTALRETGSCQTAEYGGFGASVSASNNLLAVGAPLAKSGGNIRGGKIFFYQYDPTQVANGTGGWIWDITFGFPVQNDGITSDIQADAAFGTVVSVRVDPNSSPEKAILLGGAPLYDTATVVDAGKVYVYEYTSGATPGTGTVQFVNSVVGATTGERFGRSVTSNGVSVLIGAPLHEDLGDPNQNKGAGFLYTFGPGLGGLVTLEQKIEAIESADQNTAISVSLSSGTSTTGLTGSVMLLGGASATQHKYNGLPGLPGLNGPYNPIPDSSKVGTANGDVSQSGNIAGFGYQDDRVELYYDKQDLTGGPDWVFNGRSGEPQYGRDISITDSRVMVNGNGNTTVGDLAGVAYAYYTASCYNGGELKANEWTMIGLQCDTSVASTGGSPATIGEIFSPDLGTYDTNWVMYKQNGTDYEGHQNAYVKLLEQDVMEQGQGYWIIADQDVSWSIPAAIGDASTQTARIADPIPNPNRSVRVGAVFPNTGLRAMLGTPALPVIADPNEDMRVMFSNPYTNPVSWADTLFAGTSHVNIGSIPSWFEAGDTSAYVYNTGVGTQNGYTAISATPGFPQEIKPGEGFYVKFSDAFHQDVLIDVITEIYLQLPLSK